MSLNAYLTVTGTRQGMIKGSVKIKGHKGEIAVYAYHHEIDAPRDFTTGLAAGKRQHKAISIAKEIDKSTPLLLKALITNETLSEIIFRFYAPGTNRKAEQIYTIRLTNANINNISQDMSMNKIEPGIKLPVLEEISFVYQEIEWTWVDGSIVASDEWTTIT